VTGLVATAIVRRRSLPPPEWTKTPGEGATTALLSSDRINRLPADRRRAWRDYVAVSARTRERDQESMAAELAASGSRAMAKAPYGKGFRMEPSWTREWFGSAEARRLAESVLSFQTPSGGWSKRVDLSQGPRRRGQSYYSENDRWSYIATIDNDATTSELRFIAQVDARRSDPRLERAFDRGLDYLIAAQFPNGCWPQIYPLAGGYHDASTFNDDAIVNALRLLGDVAAGSFPFVPADRRRAAQHAVDRGTDCIVAAQVTVRGRRAIWPQQCDPLTFEPVPARSYELSGLAGRESASVTRYLMSLPHPEPRVVAAVLGAVDWFREHALRGFTYDDQVLRPVAGGGPLWARLTEASTERPIFSNRDGLKLYDWNKLVDRRRGYGWFGTEPAAVLADYPSWVARVGVSKEK
jgi:PelA/Pel-15E family pectate lyase